jgi:hypothetical protein
VSPESICGACWERAVRDSARSELVPGFDPASFPPPDRARNHFGPRHPLANAVRRMCACIDRPRTSVGCGRHWEAAIIADETVVVESELPRELEVDMDWVDPVAVRLALRGERVELTAAERRLVKATPPPVPQFWAQGRLVRAPRLGTGVWPRPRLTPLEVAA